MGFQDYVSEVEAANICSVGSATLRRFAEAGYLHIESDSDGLQLFSRAELVKLFQLDESQLSPATLHTERLHQQIEVHPVNSKNSTRSDLFDESLKASGEITERTPIKPDSVATKSTLGTTQDSGYGVSPPDADPIILDQPFEPEQTAPNFKLNVATQQPAEPGSNVSAELLRLQHLVSLYEKLLDYKDGEVKNAREERDYLRRRLEWHEQQSERNQILLLAEAQSTRQLIAAQIERRSILRHALEWVGLASPPISQSGPQRAIVSMQPIEPDQN